MHENWVHSTQLFPPQMIFPSFGNISPPRTTLIGLATQVLNRSSQTCSPWILCTLFDRTPWISHNCTEISPSLGDFLIFGGLPYHPAGQWLILVTPVLNTSSRTCSQWILCTWYGRKCIRTGFIPCISFPLTQFSHPWVCISPPNSTTTAPRPTKVWYNIQNTL